MAVAKAKSGSDIINGGSYVNKGERTAEYDNEQRTAHLGAADTQEFQVLAARFRAGDWLNEITPPVGEDSVEPGEPAIDMDYAEGSDDSDDAIITLTGVPYQRHVLYGVGFSYEGDVGDNGAISISSPPGTTIFQEFITSDGAGFFPFPEGMKGAVGQDMVIQLDAPESGFCALSLMGRNRQ